MSLPNPNLRSTHSLLSPPYLYPRPSGSPSFLQYHLSFFKQAPPTPPQDEVFLALWEVAQKDVQTEEYFSPYFPQDAAAKRIKGRTRILASTHWKIQRHEDLQNILKLILILKGLKT